jgi:magnesium chelatase family protein
MVVSKYQKRISGPLLDRIDILVVVLQVEHEKLSEAHYGESSAKVQERVKAAREMQRVRFSEDGCARQQESAGQIACNADMRMAEVRKFWVLDQAGKNLMKSAMNHLQL